LDATQAPQWIAADEPPAVEVVNADGRGRAILICDHASPRIPRRLGTLGLNQPIPIIQVRSVAFGICQLNGTIRDITTVPVSPVKVIVINGATPPLLSLRVMIRYSA
jgi:hypothetical protein